MDFKFAILPMIQEFAYPLIASLGGPDIRGELEDRSDVLLEAADVLEEAAVLFNLAGAALADGILDMDEISEIVARASTLPDALVEIADAWEEDEDE